MIKKFFDCITIKPDYLVEYQESTNTYNLVVSVEQYVNITRVGSPTTIAGYAASKSHPDEPIVIKIDISHSDVMPVKNVIKYGTVSVYKFNNNEVRYTGEHDLFVYKDRLMATWAGNEMKLFEKLNSVNMNDMRESARKYASLISNAVQNAKLQEKFVDFLDTANEYYEQAKKEAENFINDENVKNIKETAKRGMSKLIDEICKTTTSVKKPYWCETEQCHLYRELNKEYAVRLKHRKNQNGSKFTVTIFNIFSPSEKTYNVTQEIFHNIYEILESNDCDTLKLNSILDIVSNLTPINSSEPEQQKDVNTKTIKDKPIQMVDFRPQDEVKQNNLFKLKFNVGDKVKIVDNKVRVTFRRYSGKIGEVIYIDKVGTGHKTLYKVKFGNNTVYLYSNEIEKVVNNEKNEFNTTNTANRKLQYVTSNFATASVTNDMYEKIKKHDEILNKILNTINDIKK